MKNKRIKYFVLFYIGFVTYITIEVCFRGYSFPLCGIMGAIDFILIDKINNKISWHLDLLIQGIIGSIIVTLSELIVGLFDRYYLHLNMWDYSTLPFNFMVIICIQFSIAWIFISIIAILLADSINYYVFKEEPIPHYHVLKWKFSFK